MLTETPPCASRLRVEITLRNRHFARGWPHVESYGRFPVIVYAPEDGRHGNFYQPAYRAIRAHPEWMRRFEKIHAQGRSLPRPTIDSARRWRELDSSTSSDALLMNIFCTPQVADSTRVRQMLGVPEGNPVLGWRARVPLNSGRVDRTEVDMRWGDLLVESKLTESDFQCREAAVVESYLAFDEVFDRDRLPRVEIRTRRRREAIEFPEEFTQEWEMPINDDGAAAQAFQGEVAARADERQPRLPGYASYQLIRNVLAAHSHGCSFCVIHDERRPDLREAWFEVISAIRSAEIRTRCKVLTWQELVPLLPEGLRRFLDLKYGIVAPGRFAQSIDELPVDR